MRLFINTAVVCDNRGNMIPKYLKEVTKEIEQGTEAACPGALSNSINVNLVQLIVTPENCPNSKIIDMTLVNDEEVSPRNSNISSAYSMIFSCNSPY